MRSKGDVKNKRDAVEKRTKILLVAEEIFSEVGFDGARVDDIAKKACVNKALIYYYFKSKDEILDTLFTSLVEDVKKILIKSVERSSDIGQEDSYRDLFNKYMNFIIEKRKIIKVAIAESTKSASNISIVMKVGNLIIDSEMENIRKAYEAKGLSFPVDKQELLITEFFTGLMPLFSYALYKDEWERFYNISEEELREKFYQSFKKTHLAAHLIT
ncbi:TPA: TetR/AcrR family transcriptional regulator [Methanosarcina acetivorans]|uniref:Transcriptional regulator, TetR family n=2 Tax=Methanosarcina acetivorans TaxID=2214 RepID=Q8TK36_METAC|nr:TetR/AcrR family transcriptional regulator [Methanosarcina acetivorans]AAM06944.1 transcriptional regulator, TetR family [Methanosarcina acetivorans C2A]HIH93397.1 TetR/AcrR family transcriptional regulator [Methanosarcina acetivorans]